MKSELRRLRSIYKAFQCFHGGKIQCNYPPQIPTIELTTRCNLNCVFCARKVVEKDRGFGDMPFSMFKDIVESYPESCRNLRLSHHGEPTLYPRIVDAVQFAAEKDYVKSVGFTTNGNFDSSLLDELFEAGLTVISFSFEGTDPKVYRKLRGGNFRLVFLNIHKAILLKQKYPNVIVRLNVMRNNLTEKDLSNFLSYWNGFPITVDVANLHDWGGNINTEDLGNYMVTELPSSCFNAWFLSVIHYNGDVVPCCFWFKESMGNIFKKDLTEIWNDYPYHNLRYDLAKGRENHPQCMRCYLRPMNESPYQLSKRNPFFPLDSRLPKILWDSVKRRVSNRQPKVRRVEF